jgi:hypothetical protein
MEVSGSDKHYSLLQYTINYGRKTIVQAPAWELNNIFGQSCREFTLKTFLEQIYSPFCKLGCFITVNIFIVLQMT